MKEESNQENWRMNEFAATSFKRDADKDLPRDGEAPMLFPAVNRYRLCD
jgi:hypothetical protein